MRHLSVLLLACLILLAGVFPGLSTAQYSDATANSMVLASGAAYCSKASVESASCPPCKRVGFRDAVYLYDQKLNIAGYVARAGISLLGQETREALDNYLLKHGLQDEIHTTDGAEVVLVVFRGTQPASLENWIQNLKFSKAEPIVGGNCPGCTVHQGFQESYNSLRAGVASAVKARSSGAAAIITTGHSLGGAMAALASWDLFENQILAEVSPLVEERYFAKLPVFSYTFGQPRVGNPAFVQNLNGKLVNNFRIVHGQDIVAHLPPMLLDFRHLRQEIWFRGAGSVCTTANNCIKCDLSGEDPNCSNSVVNLSIPDHLKYLDQSVSGMC